MSTLKHLFDNNIAWANSIKESNPDFFSQLSKQQAPEYLWIGCSDSRVPANEIINLPPGEVFVHRNIANVVVHTDMNCLSVIHYAIAVLKIKHIIVCGHYGCGGVKAAIDDQRHGLIDNWLQHIKDVHHKHRDSLTGLDSEQTVEKMCELNVMEQVKNVCHTTVVQDAWQSGSELSVHGLIYNIKNGILHDLNVGMSSNKELWAKDI